MILRPLAAVLVVTALSGSSVPLPPAAVVSVSEASQPARPDGAGDGAQSWLCKNLGLFC